MKYTVKRCMKRPGLIERARTYFLEFNEKGLYIIKLGPAGQKPYIPRETLVTVAAQALAKPFINKMEQKMEEEIATGEQRLVQGELESMSGEKHSYFLTKNQVTDFQLKQEGDVIKISIQGANLSIKLYASAAYLGILEEMQQAIGRN